MFKKKILIGVVIGLVIGGGIGSGTTVIALINTGKATQGTHKSLEDINGKQNGLFYEKKISMESKGKQIILNIAKLDSSYPFFATETYLTSQKRSDSLDPQPIDSLKVIKSEISKSSSPSLELEINSLFKEFLIKNKIANANFQKIKSIEQLNKAFPKAFLSFLEGKTLKSCKLSLQTITTDSKNLLSSIKKKYNLNFFKKNDLIILKGLETFTSYTTYYSHTPTIHSIKSSDKQIDIVVDFGQQTIGSDKAFISSFYSKSTTHFLAIPKDLPQTLKVSYIYSK